MNAPARRLSASARGAAILGYAVFALGGLSAGAAAERAVSNASYACKDGKTVRAVYYADRVDLALSDGRSMSLPQTMSGSGIRYANSDESFVFWSKGDTAFATEGDPNTPTYADCVAIGSSPAKVVWTTFTSKDPAFSIAIPEGYAVDPGYRYDGLGPGKEIAGVAFTIPERMWQGSNLAADTRLTVERLQDTAACTADRFLPEGATAAKAVKDKGVAYSMATFSDAGAGNLYSERVYALAGSKPCVAVRTFIHSSNIANYDPGTVEAFDEKALTGQFDKIRRTLVLGR
jgi:membrane-bound inhibitor of C-type lysozyme